MDLEILRLVWHPKRKEKFNFPSLFDKSMKPNNARFRKFIDSWNKGRLLTYTGVFMKMSYENATNSIHTWTLVATCKCGIVIRIPFDSLVQGMSVACECGEKATLHDVAGLRVRFGLAS